MPIEWIFEFSQYLFEKYIQSSSELCVNLSGCTRYSLCQFFKLSPDAAFEYIRDHRFGELTDREREIIGQNPKAHDTKLIKTYLYHCFDIAFNQIWSLLRDDVFLRFQSTEEYRELHLSKRKKRKTSSPQHGNMPLNPILVSNTTFSVGSVQFSASPSLREINIHPPPTPEPPEPMKTALPMMPTMSPMDKCQSAPSVQSSEDRFRIEVSSTDDEEERDHFQMMKTDDLVVLEEPGDDESGEMKECTRTHEDMEDSNDIKPQIQISLSSIVSVEM